MIKALYFVNLLLPHFMDESINILLWLPG